MKICIIGNGAVSYFTALKLSDFPSVEISILGPKNYDGNASLVAGAMHASTGEVESELVEGSLDKFIYEISLQSRDLMREALEEYSPSSITANGTVVFLNAEHNIFERRNFDFVVNAAQTYDTHEDVSTSDFFNNKRIRKKEKIIYLNREFSFDPRELLSNLEKILQAKGVNFINDVAKDVDVKNNTINTKSNGKLNFEKIIVANGSGDLHFNNLQFQFIPSFRGLGTALLCKSNDAVDKSIEPNVVYRSVNRGGSQCGFHFVPCVNDGYYIGAGNRLAFKNDRSIRFETVRYLLNEAEQDLLGSQAIYAALGNVLLGNRSRSFDYYPIFGPLRENKSIFIAKGFNRVALSLAPLLANEIYDFFADECDEQLGNMFLPQRGFISHGSPEYCANEFALMTCANLIEHSLLKQSSAEYSEKLDELFNVGMDYIKLIQQRYNLDSEYGPAPDALSVLANYDSFC